MLQKILVIQRGARHRYAIPRMLYERQLLAAFYTDACSISSLGVFAKRLGTYSNSRIRRLTQRVIEGVPSHYIKATDRIACAEVIDGLRGKRRTEIETLLYHSELLSKQAIRWGIGDAQYVYTMYSENADFVEWAAKQGAKVIVELYTNPARDEIVNVQCERLGLPQYRISENDIADEQNALAKVIHNSSVILCPSEFVKLAAIRRFPQKADQMRVVPYGCSLKTTQTKTKCTDSRANTSNVVTATTGRIFVAGGNPIIKGFHELAEAIRRLPSSIKSIDVRIAGGMPQQIIEDPKLSNLHFLGKLSKEEMLEEYSHADVVVMPSIVEGFPAVVSEAIVAGCPFIATKECGVPKELEQGGLIINSSNPAELADAIFNLLSNQKLRESKAAFCRESREFFTEDRWADRLLDAIFNKP